VVNYNLSVSHGYEDAKPQRFWGHDLSDHMTSSVMRPMDSPWSLSYWWSM